jgi:hypothetical protein
MSIISLIHPESGHYVPSDNTATAICQNVNMDDVSIRVDVQLLLLNRRLNRALGIEDVIEFLELIIILAYAYLLKSVSSA